MKRALYLCIFLLVGIGYSQNKTIVEIVYKEKSKKNLKKELDEKLIINGSKSFFIIEKKVFATKEKKGVEETRVEKKGVPKQVYFKDFKTNTLVIQVGEKEDVFTVQNDLRKYNWQLKDETKKIEKYNCKKATTQTKWGEVVAWYTDEFSIIGAPRDYDGLPGLVVYLENSSATYELKKVNLLKGKIKLPVLNNEAKRMTKEEIKKGVVKTKRITKETH